jgi:glycosyltransferase involved in cell wall biosynthesis
VRENVVLDRHRVLLVAHGFPPTFGGVETHLWDIAHGLAHRRWKVTCLVGGATADERFGEVSVRRRPELEVGHLVAGREGLTPTDRNEALEARLAAVVEAALRAFRPDVVHMHNAHHFAPELAEAFFARRQRTALVNTVHDNVGEHLYPTLLDGPWQGTLFVSRYVFSTLPPARGAVRIRHLGIDTRRFTPAGEVDERLARLEWPVVFHPARLLRWKGVEVGLEAFIRLRHELGRGSLVMCESSQVVDDPDEVGALRDALQARARAAGVAERVHFLSFDRATIQTAYRASDVVWYPTIDEEPLGLGPLEAMACGRPLVVSDSGGMRETVRDGETGFVVPKGDPDALANAAKRLLADGELRARFCAAGREHAQTFALDAYVDDLAELYLELIR